MHFTLVFIYYVARNYRVEQEEHSEKLASTGCLLLPLQSHVHLRALSDILSYSPKDGCWAAVLMYPSWELPSLTVTGRQDIGPNTFNQVAEGGPVHVITMQSLGSTPLLPLIKRAPQWKIHLALFKVCFPTDTLFTLTCTYHSSTLVCLFTSYTVLFIDTVLKSYLRSKQGCVECYLLASNPNPIKAFQKLAHLMFIYDWMCLHFLKSSTTIETCFNQQGTLI